MRNEKYLPCEVCKTPTLRDYDVMEWGNLCEDYVECPKGCYSYEFAYGNSMEVIMSREWHWTYLETAIERMRRHRERTEWLEEVLAFR